VIRRGKLYLKQLLVPTTIRLEKPDESPFWKQFGMGPLGDADRQRLFTATGCDGFPIPAEWFSGRLQIPAGKRMIYSHQGWSNWYERLRIIHIREGSVVRDREVNTKAILERRLAWHPETRDWLEGKGVRRGLEPLTWFEPDYRRKA
jgi:hypothetical protein